jgi:hypothetical protein
LNPALALVLTAETGGASPEEAHMR